MFKITMLLFSAVYLLFATPKKPAKLTLTPFVRSVNISWIDTNNELSSYKIFRDGKLIAYLPRPILSDYFDEDRYIYKDEGLDPNTTYRYTIKATDDLFVGVRDFNTKKRSYIEQIISLFEHDNNRFNYGYAEFLPDFRQRGATVGRIFVTLNNFDDFHNSSDAMEVIELLLGENFDIYNYAQHNDNTLPFIDFDRLENINISWDSGEKAQENRSFVDNIMLKWSLLSQNSKFQNAQDSIFYKKTYLPAINKILKTFNGYAISSFTFLTIVDLYVVRGVDDDENAYGGDGLIDEAFRHYGDRAIFDKEDERRWLRIFLDIRSGNGSKDDIEGRSVRIEALKDMLRYPELMDLDWKYLKNFMILHYEDKKLEENYHYE